jgi:hypothetical protein
VVGTQLLNSRLGHRNRHILSNSGAQVGMILGKEFPGKWNKRL